MNNANMPATPTVATLNRKCDSFQEKQTDSDDFMLFGLTKREHIAAMAMQGLLSNQEWMHNAGNNTGMGLSEVVTKGAIGMADALLKELEK